MKNSYSIDLGKKKMTATLVERVGSRLTFEVQGTSYTATVSPVCATPQPPVSSSSSFSVSAQPSLSRSAQSASAPAEDHIITPLPGLVAAVLVQVGQSVEAGTPLAVVEAMKMENSVPSPRSGTIVEVLVTVGQELSVGDTLVRLS